MAQPRRPTSKPGDASGPPARRARGSLSPEEILDGARELVERDGLQQLSMPALAKHLQSGVTSIYWYFRSKDDLLSALTDRVTHDLYRSLPPVGDGPWDEELIAYFVAFRDLLEATPVYREVFAYRARLLFARSSMAPAMLKRLDEGLGLFTRAGLTADQAADAVNACSNYTRGFVLLEAHAGTDDGDPPMPRLDAYGTLREVTDVERLVQLDDEQFDYGLRLLIDGIRRHYGLA